METMDELKLTKLFQDAFLEYIREEIEKERKMKLVSFDKGNGKVIVLEEFFLIKTLFTTLMIKTYMTLNEIRMGRKIFHVQHEYDPPNEIKRKRLDFVKNNFVHGFLLRNDLNPHLKYDFIVVDSVLKEHNLDMIDVMSALFNELEYLIKSSPVVKEENGIKYVEILAYVDKLYHFATSLINNGFLALGDNTTVSNGMLNKTPDSYLRILSYFEQDNIENTLTYVKKEIADGKRKSIYHHGYEQNTRSGKDGLTHAPAPKPNPRDRGKRGSGKRRK